MKNVLKKMMNVIETSINNASTKSQCLGYALAIPAIMHSYQVGKKCKNGEIGKGKAVALIYVWSTVAGLTAGIVAYLSYLHFEGTTESEDLKKSIDHLKESSKPWGDKLDDEIDAEEELKF